MTSNRNPKRKPNENDEGHVPRKKNNNESDDEGN